MDSMHSFSRRSLVWLLLLNLLFFAVIDGAVYFLAGYVFSGDTFSEVLGMASSTTGLETWAEAMRPLFAWIRALFFPVTLALFVAVALIQWAVLRAVLRRAMQKSPTADRDAEKKSRRTAKKSAEPGGPDVSEREIRQQYQRYYLHLLWVLQRQGRLLDFLKENLSAYEDAQIGAAVRSIHENCADTVEKNLAPRAIIEKAEGEQLTVPADFDPSAIKLTGNVTGEPPFTGILRHKGWRAGKLELPVLSSTGDPRIIAPAEVEIT
ncbi:MAG: DUF2760 domain-containing protein [Desulfobacterales bacterium]|nr:DUF2760 domain-containing protein [Desulfobacterales bacterium]